jgi:Skp family chaperone for outer membrane proteins
MKYLYGGKEMRIAAIAAVFCAIGMSLTYAAFTANPPAPAQTIGVVNVSRVMDQYDKAKEAKSELGTMKGRAEERLGTAQVHRLLTKAETLELITLLEKDKPTPGEQSRIAALKDLDKTREAQLKAVQAEKNPTDQQIQQLRDFGGYVKESETAIKEKIAAYQKAYGERNTQLTIQIAKDVKAAVAAVSQEKNTPMALNQDAVIQGGTDITDAVIAKLKK